MIWGEHRCGVYVQWEMARPRSPGVKLEEVGSSFGVREGARSYETKAWATHWTSPKASNAPPRTRGVAKRPSERKPGAPIIHAIGKKRLNTHLFILDAQQQDLLHDSQPGRPPTLPRILVLLVDQVPRVERDLAAPRKGAPCVVGRGRVDALGGDTRGRRVLSARRAVVVAIVGSVRGAVQTPGVAVFVVRGG